MAMARHYLVVCCALTQVEVAAVTCHAISTVVTDDWCNNNCNLSPPNCPAQMCSCDYPPPPPTPPVPTPTPPADSQTWAVLAAGSSTYWNYRHQADICHAYQILKGHGVDPDHIITLIYDDVAHADNNPFPGKLFNQPNGPDVYGGCQVDYRGDALSPELFLSVLKGDSAKVASLVGGNGNANGKVLQSGPDDNVFIYFADHGGSGMIMFPGGAISASDLTSTLTDMHSRSMYRELVFYLDTCESGSMFTQLPTDINVMAVSSARPDENANAIWCYEPDTDIQGKNIGACLGDAMSVGWMMDSDKNFGETLRTQFATVKDWSMTSRCNPIPCFNMPCMYGDASIADEPLARFQGQPSSAHGVTTNRARTNLSSAIDARDVKLHLLEARLQSNDATKRADALAELKAEQAHRRRVDEFFAGLARSVCADGSCEANLLLQRSEAPSKRLQVTYEDCHPKTIVDLDCHKQLIDAISSPSCTQMSWGDYSGKYAKLLADFCDVKGADQVVEHIRESCQGETFIA